MSIHLPPPVPNPGPEECAQVVCTEVTFHWLQSRLRARGLYLFPIPVGDEDLPTYGVGIGDPHPTTADHDPRRQPEPEIEEQ
jgi:hypothetical protein